MSKPLFSLILRTPLRLRRATGIWKPMTLMAALSTAAFAGTMTLQEVVSSHDAPWTYVNGGLNTAFQYGLGDELSPVVINKGAGFNFSPGGQFTIQWVNGFVSAGPGFPAVDANGQQDIAFDNFPGTTGDVAPSAYMNPGTYPIFLMELVGTFASSTGAIVGTPFAIGDGPFTVAVPSGATQLQLGVNDDKYSDNAGSFFVDVTGPTSGSPEPATAGFALVGIALAALAARLRPNRRDSVR